MIVCSILSLAIITFKLYIHNLHIKPQLWIISFNPLLNPYGNWCVISFYSMLNPYGMLIYDSLILVCMVFASSYSQSFSFMYAYAKTLICKCSIHLLRWVNSCSHNSEFWIIHHKHFFLMSLVRFKSSRWSTFSKRGLGRQAQGARANGL